MARNQKTGSMPKETAEHMKAAVEMFRTCNGFVFSVDIPTSAIVAISTNAKKPSPRTLNTGVQTSDDSFKGVDVPEDVEYRKKPLEPRQELIFDRLYVTKTGKPTFVFKPCDAREWVHAEFDLDTIDKVFPDFSYKIAERMKVCYSGLRLPADPRTSDLYGRAINYIARKEKEMKEAEAEKMMAQMEQHPDWGAF